MSWPGARQGAWIAPGVWMVAWGGVMTAAGVGFALIAEDVLDRDGLTAADPVVLSLARQHRHSWLTGLMRLLTDAASPAVLAFAAALIGAWLAWRRSSAGPLILLGAAGIGSIGIGTAVKLLVERPRPPVAWRAVGEDGFSFPSQHSMTAVAVAGMLAYLITTGWPVRDQRRWRWRVMISAGVWVGAVLAAVAVGASRVYLGVHWPSDVLGSGMLGAGWLAALITASTARQTIVGLIGTTRLPASAAGAQVGPSPGGRAEER